MQDGGAVERAKILEQVIHRTEVFLVLDLHKSNNARSGEGETETEGTVERVLQEARMGKTRA